jgi:hypothetical protein
VRIGFQRPVIRTASERIPSMRAVASRLLLFAFLVVMCLALVGCYYYN